MSGGSLTLALRAASGALFACALFAAARAAAQGGRYPGRARVARYEAYLDRTLRLLFVKGSAKAILRVQLAGVAVGALSLVATSEPVSLLVVAVALAAPALYLAVERAKRRAKFDRQVDSFVLALANSLKAVPSIGAALQGLGPVLQDPVRQEVALVLNEVRLGSSIEHALLNAAARADSRSFDAAVSALLVGRQVGGDLPKILETTAACIREMGRLEGVLRSKTSESRAQLWVLGFFPAGIVGAFRLIEPDYFDPLRYTEIGHLVAGVAVTLWVGAVLLARKLGQVDL